MHILFGNQWAPAVPALALPTITALHRSVSSSVFMGTIYDRPVWIRGESECLPMCQPRASYSGIPELQVAHSLILSFSTVSRLIHLRQHNLCCILCQYMIPNPMYFP